MSLAARSNRRAGMGAVDAVSATPAGPLTVAVDETSALTAVALNASDRGLSLVGRDVRWTTSNASVATVAKTGLATATVTGAGAGTCNITPVVDGVTGTAVAFTIEASGAAAQLAISTQPAGAVIDTPFTTQPVIRIEDEDGNLIADSTAEVTVTRQTGTGTLSGDAAVNAVNGIATFTDLELDAAGAHTLRFASTGLTSADSNSFAVTDPGSPPAAIFATDWPDTGATSNAVRSIGNAYAWDTINNLGGANPSIEVVTSASTGYDFPTTNCLKVLFPATAGQGGAFLGVFNGWELPEIGGDLWRRRYVVHNVGPTSSSGHYHPEQSCSVYGGGGDCGDVWVHYRNNEDPLFPPMWYVVHGVSEHIWTPETMLTKEVVYRYEEQLHRVDTNTIWLKLWIYERSGGVETLVRSPSDFICGNGGAHSSETGDDEVEFDIDIANLRHFGIADQGVSAIGLGSDDTDHQHIYYAGFKIAYSGPIGPYVAGEAD